MPLGPWELLIILFVVLLVFGAKKVPEMGRSLGSGMREFKEGLTNPFSDDKAQRKQLESVAASADDSAETKERVSV